MESNIIKVHRHELKFLMSQIEYRYLKGLLGVLMRKDINMKAQKAYNIRSLYFDSITNIDYNNKVIGIADRKKIRFRIYDLAADTVKLEIKNRKNEYSFKETMTLRKEDALCIMRNDFRSLLTYENKVAQKVYNIFSIYCYMPKVIVDYKREAYVLPIENVRLTFDKEVEALKSRDLFDRNPMKHKVLPADQIILEVKYDKYLPPHIINALSSVSMQRQAISKYCMAREVVG